MLKVNNKKINFEKIFQNFLKEESKPKSYEYYRDGYDDYDWWDDYEYTRNYSPQAKTQKKQTKKNGYNTEGKVIYFYPNVYVHYKKETFESLAEFDKYLEKHNIKTTNKTVDFILSNDVVYCTKHNNQLICESTYSTLMWEIDDLYCD